MTEHGYSGRSLPAKLGLKSGMRVCVLNPPQHYASLLTPLPEPLHWQPQPSPDCDWVHGFFEQSAALQHALALARATLPGHAALWISWPKRAAKRATDLSEDGIRDRALPLGWVDVKVCAVDATWSGLKLVVRRALR